MRSLLRLHMPECDSSGRDGSGALTCCRWGRWWGPDSVCCGRNSCGASRTGGASWTFATLTACSGSRAHGMRGIVSMLRVATPGVESPDCWPSRGVSTLVVMVATVTLRYRCGLGSKESSDPPPIEPPAASELPRPWTIRPWASVAIAASPRPPPPRRRVRRPPSLRRRRHHHVLAITAWTIAVGFRSAAPSMRCQCHRSGNLVRPRRRIAARALIEAALVVRCGLSARAATTVEVPPRSLRPFGRRDLLESPP